MSKSLFPIQKIAKNPEQLFACVMAEIQNGNDLYTQPFVTAAGEIVQYMVTSPSLYEYRLINAADLDDLDTQVQNLAALSYDFMFSTVQWNGRYLQWMVRVAEKRFQHSAISQEQFTSLQPSAVAMPVVEGQQLRVVREAMPVFSGRFLGGV